MHGSGNIEQQDAIVELGPANGDAAVVSQEHLGLKNRLIVFLDFDLIADSFAIHIRRHDRKGSFSGKGYPSFLVKAQV